MSMSNSASSITVSAVLISRHMGLPPLMLKLAASYLRVIVCLEGVRMVSGSEPSVLIEISPSGAEAGVGGGCLEIGVGWKSGFGLYSFKV